MDRFSIIATSTEAGQHLTCTRADNPGLVEGRGVGGWVKSSPKHSQARQTKPSAAQPVTPNARNPKNGKIIQTEDKNSISFKMSKKLKNEINNSERKIN